MNVRARAKGSPNHPDKPKELEVGKKMIASGTLIRDIRTSFYLLNVKTAAIRAISDESYTHYLSPFLNIFREKYHLSAYLSSYFKKAFVSPIKIKQGR